MTPGHDATYLAAIVNSSDDAIIGKDLHGIITSWNAAAARTFGYAAEEIVGRPIDVLIPPDRLDEEKLIIDRLQRGERVEHFETVRRTKAGQDIPVSLTISPIRGSDGVVIGASKIARPVGKGRSDAIDILERPVRKLLIIDDDVDDHRAYVRSLRKATDHRYQIVTATRASDGVAAAQLQYFDCILLDLNLPDRSGIDVLGELIKLSHLVSCAILVVTGEGNGTVAVEAMKRGAQDYLIKGVQTQDLLLSAIDRAIDARTSQVSRDASFQASAEATIMLQLQVEEREKAERAAAAAREQAERANAAKSAFLANMSHEIRTPMNGILGMTSLLLEMELGDEQRHYAAAIHQSATSLLGLLNDILDLAKLEAGRIELENIDFDLEELVEGTVQLVSAKAVEKDLELCAFIDDRVRRRFFGDPTRLRQVLLNLIGNAVKFTAKGFVVVRVQQLGADEVEGDVARARLRIDVSDSGIGIPTEAMGRLFQKFNQADNSITRRFGGTGLGLAISRDISALMGGTLSVESEVGKGSTFTLEIALPCGAPMSLPETWIARLAGRRVLVVDNFEMLRRVLGRQLQRVGMDVSEASDGFAALVELQRAHAVGSPYHLALVDQIMPGMSGEELAREIRKYPSLADLKLVLMSPLGIPAKIGGTERAPIDALLNKPASFKTMIECLANLLFPGEKLVSATRRSFLSGPGPETQQRHKWRILLAEDNLINQEVAAGILRKAGYAVDVAEDGISAVDVARAGKHDLILMDMQMPGMDGVEATHKIRAIEGVERVPIIAMTAHAMHGTREQCLAAGMDDYVAKPIDPRGFLATVRRWTVGAETNSPQVPHVTAVQQTDGLPILDEDRFASLRASMGIADFDDLVARAPRRLEERIEKLQKAFMGGDLAAIGREAHTLIGGAGNIGAMALAALARQLEWSTSQQDRESLHKTMRAIDDNTPQTLAALRAKFFAAPT